MKSFLFTIRKYIDRFLFGGRCLGCATFGEALCASCLSRIPLSSTTDHPGIYGIYSYSDPVVSRAIWNLKYYRRGTAAKLLSEKARDSITEIISETLQTDKAQTIIFVPIPQHKKKTNLRGFNQSTLIAQWFSEHTNPSEVRELLEKYQQTVPQSHIGSKTLRMKNISNTMRATARLDGKALYIIVDDVTTTGATFLEATRALRSAGARNILSIALAHGYKRK